MQYIIPLKIFGPICYIYEYLCKRMFVFVAAEKESIRSAMTGVMDGCDYYVGPRNETEPWSSTRVPHILNC